MHFDDVLEQIGEGIFQKFAIFVCGLAVLAEAIATASVPFAMILASCDLKISTDHILGLNAIFLLGTLISGYWLGGICDISGRKYILSTTSIITFVACFVASFAQCIIMLFTSLFILGLGLGGSHGATRVFVIEITPKSYRGSRFVTLEVFFAVGYASAVGLSTLLVPPLASNLLGNYVRLNSWRVLFGLSGSLSIFSACLMSVFPASPRWLLGKKQEENAIDVLRKIYAINNVKHEESFPNIRLDPIAYVNTKLDSRIYQCNNPMARSVRSIRFYTKYLFTKKLLKMTLVSIFISAFLFDG
ncbi:hypothetical protein RUM44_005358 [Polyplax serrata]|uniref:Major facilitator superfamily (MFS) profile domain-containing protein n=1 Tax=Polyplax serrata TaxID=468196 RepID=A0ABR1ADB6_POLSC